jgi:hypothetical protein
MVVALAMAALALQPAAPASPGPFTVVFARNTTARTLHPEGQQVVTAVAAALRADPDAAVIVEARGWGGFENYSIAQCRWGRRARRALIAQGIASERIAIRAPNAMQWERAPPDTRQTPQPQLHFRLGSAAEAANARVMPDSCLSRLRP